MLAALARSFSVQAELAVARAARTAVLGIGGIIALGIGMAFFTLAMWIYLNLITSALVASVIMGCLFSGVGLVFFAVLSAQRNARVRARLAARAAPPPAPHPEPLLGRIVMAFIAGMTAGRKSRF
tara:strand:- start:29 stop:403 length:375 start_codon:yes stop_codon:yes gene_type:complete